MKLERPSRLPRFQLGFDLIGDSDLYGDGSLAGADGHRPASTDSPDFGRIFHIDGAATIAAYLADRDKITQFDADPLRELLRTCGRVLDGILPGLRLELGCILQSETDAVDIVGAGIQPRLNDLTQF